MADVTLTLQLGDGVLARYGNQLAHIADGDAKKVFSRAMNHEGDKTRTQIKRALVKSTGIKSSLVSKGMKTVRSTPRSLIYSLVQRGDETNLGYFKARATKSGVSAAPWNRRQIFRGDNPSRGSFFLPGTGLVFIRTGAPRYPIRALFGPNIARELMREDGEPLAQWNGYAPRVLERIGHELGRILPV